MVTGTGRMRHATGSRVLRTRPGAQTTWTRPPILRAAGGHEPPDVRRLSRLNAAHRRPPCIPSIDENNLHASWLFKQP